MSPLNEMSAEQTESPVNLMESKLEAKTSDSSSSSSDSDSDTRTESQSKIARLFGRQRSVHHVLGGGRAADVFLWRDKKISAIIFCAATAIWILFALAEYHLLTLVSHILIFCLAILFAWSNIHIILNRSRPHMPEVHLPQEICEQVALALRMEANRALSIFHDIALGKDLKKFLIASAGLWAISWLGSCVSFVTLSYTCFIFLHTVFVVYERHEDKVDVFAEKATTELKRQYGRVGQNVPKMNEIVSKLQRKRR